MTGNKNLEDRIKQLEEQLLEANNNYRQLSMEVGREVFKYEELEKTNFDLEKENNHLNEEIDKLRIENKKLQEFKDTVESSTSYKLKKIFK